MQQHLLKDPTRVVSEHGDDVEEDAKDVEVEVLHMNTSLGSLLNDHLRVDAGSSTQDSHHERQDHADRRCAKDTVRIIIHLRHGAAKCQK